MDNGTWSLDSNLPFLSPPRPPPWECGGGNSINKGDDGGGAAPEKWTAKVREVRPAGASWPAASPLFLRTSDPPPGLSRPTTHTGRNLYKQPSILFS